ncbi:hypothetical protein THAR02_08178 [Trichoderma harzianum]|uniref:Uncharacterized protein n=1 Tax=Trichoderma harzianum TaxID=5544 RepID=A0A0F9ZHE9_TRIHA|nr:hypothetical protein THAR02_08178 [Trichoderma harzianum]
MSSEYPYRRLQRLDLEDIKISITHESYTTALQTVDYYHRQAITLTPDEQEKYLEMVRIATLDQNYADNKNASGWEQPDDPEDTPNKCKDKEDDNRQPKKLKVTTSRFRLPDDDYGEDPSTARFAGTPLPNSPAGTGESRTNKMGNKIAALELELELQTERELRQAQQETIPSLGKQIAQLEDPDNVYSHAHFVMLTAAYGISKLSHLREDVEEAGDTLEINDLSQSYNHYYHTSMLSATEERPASVDKLPSTGDFISNRCPRYGLLPSTSSVDDRW